MDEKGSKQPNICPQRPKIRKNTKYSQYDNFPTTKFLVIAFLLCTSDHNSATRRPFLALPRALEREKSGLLANVFKIAKVACLGKRHMAVDACARDPTFADVIDSSERAYLN